MKLGDSLPNINVSTTSQEAILLTQFVGKKLVLYFYPKDNTPSCTTQGQDFRDTYQKFLKTGSNLLGVSRESIRSHQNFIKKHDFPFALISDPNEELCKAFDVIKEKKCTGDLI